jgi:hypothetical protein
MGKLYFRQNGIESDPTDVQNPPTDTNTSNDTVPATTDPWLVVVIIMGLLIVLTLAVFMLAHHLNSRRRRARLQLMERNEKTSLPYSRRRKLSSADRHMIEEQEREMMIRKSLAEKPTFGGSGFHVSQASSDSGSQPDDRSEEHGEPTSLREDWKAWEARIQSERKSLTPGGIGLEQHPAFASPISTPQPPRLPSPIRGVPQSRLYEPLPKIVVA